jgi:hypothetical protein
LGARNLFAFGIALLVTYWFDQRYYHGATSAAAISVFRDIAAGFK